MPRKAKPPMILRIECVSTGQEYKPEAEVMVDDFTGQVIEPIQAKPEPLRPRRDAQDYIDEANRAKALHARKVLEVLMPQVVDWVVEPKPEPKPLTLGGQGITITREAKPWRRV